MDTEAVAAVVGIGALLVIGWRRSVDRYRAWKEKPSLADLLVAEERARMEQRIREKRAEAHRAHPTVHRWPNDRDVA